MILLHTTKYGENSLILHCYSEEEGRCSLMLRSISGKKKGGNNSGTALLHPLSILDFEVTKPKSGTMPCVKEYSARHNLHSLRTDFSKTAVAMFIGELLFRTLLLPEKDERLYKFIEDSILELEHFDGSTANFHLWFLLHYSAHLGFSPDNGYTNEYNPFTPQQTATIGRLFQCRSIEEAMSVPLTGDFRSELTAAILKFLEFHTGNSIHLKSLAVFHKIFNVQE